MLKGKFEFPPPIFTWKTNLKVPVIKWEKGKGIRMMQEPLTLEFPPRLFTAEFHEKDKDEQ